MEPDSLIPTTGSASPPTGHRTGLARTPRCVLTPDSPPENLSTPHPGGFRRDPSQGGPLGPKGQAPADTAVPTPGSAGPTRTRRLSQQRPDPAGKSTGPGVQGPGFECHSRAPPVPCIPAFPSVSRLWPPSRPGPAPACVLLLHTVPLSFLTDVTLASSQVTNDHKTPNAMCHHRVKRPYAWSPTPRLRKY